jgi:hypothetical protein
MQTENEEKKRERERDEKKERKEKRKQEKLVEEIQCGTNVHQRPLFFFCFFFTHTQLIRISPYFANVGNSSVLPKSNLLVASPDLPPDEY